MIDNIFYKNKYKKMKHKRYKIQLKMYKLNPKLTLKDNIQYSMNRIE